MSAANEIARLKRVIAELGDAIAADARRPSMNLRDRRTLRSEIETCIRTLDELRSKINSA